MSGFKEQRWAVPGFVSLIERSSSTGDQLEAPMVFFGAGAVLPMVLRWPLWDFPKGQVLSLVGDVQGAVEPFLHGDFPRSCRLFDLVEHAVMDDGKVVLDRALVFDTEHPIQLSAVRRGPVEIGLRSSLFPNLLLYLGR